MPATMYSESEVQALIRQAARETARSTAEQMTQLVRAEVERVSRQRLTTRQAAAYIGIGRTALLRYADEGRIRYEDRGGSVGYVFNRSDLDALADALAMGEIAKPQAD